MSGTVPVGSEDTAWNEQAVVEHIGATWEAAEVVSKSVYDQSREAIKFAVECGNWLNFARQHVKDVPWQEWVVNRLGKCYKTAKRYMLLAERYGTHVSSGQELPFQTLRQAYIIAGIVQPPKRAAQLSPAEEDAQKAFPVTLAAALLPFTRWRKRVFNKQLEGVTPKQLEEWLKELEEPHNTYLRIQEMLNR